MIAILASLCLLVPPVMAGSVVLGWDVQPGVSFKVWRGTTLVKTVVGNRATITLPDRGVSTVRVTAFIPGGMGESAPAEITVLPVVVQHSTDLRAWTTWRVLYVQTAAKMFFRLTPPDFTTP